MIKYSTKDITVASNGLVVYKDSYWLCEAGDPKRALFFGKSPQCNTDKRVTEWIYKHNYESHPNIGIVFVETGFVPPRD